MNWFSAIVVFIISWWLILLAILPIGVRGQHEDGPPKDGTEPGAPVEARFAKKALWALYGAIGVTVIAYIIGISGIIQRPDVHW